MTKEKEKAALEKVTLKTAHKHKGVQYKAGDVIDVNATQKAWLIEHDKIQLPKTAG